MKTTLSEPQIRIMRAIQENGDPYVAGMNPGGRDRAYQALLRHGLVDGHSRSLTETGRVALAAVDEAAATVKAAYAAQRVRRRVDSAAARFLAESRDGNVGAEPTDENLAAAFANVVRPIPSELYPQVRERVIEIRTQAAARLA